jgi:hypothetical protein
LRALLARAPRSKLLLQPRPNLGHASQAKTADQQATPKGPVLVQQQQQQQQQHRRLNVVWLSRSWFGRSMKAGGGLTGWQASRDLSHDTEDEIVKALELAVMDWNNEVCAPPTFGWWQRVTTVQPATGCRPSHVSFNFRVSGE